MSLTEASQIRAALPGKLLTQSAVAFISFAVLSYLGTFNYAFFALASMMGLVLPLAWGKIHGDWEAMGFTRRNLRGALLWGLGGGVVTALIGLWVIPYRSIPDNLGIQLAVGVPSGS